MYPIVFAVTVFVKMTIRIVKNNAFLIIFLQRFINLSEGRRILESKAIIRYFFAQTAPNAFLFFVAFMPFVHKKHIAARAELLILYGHAFARSCRFFYLMNVDYFDVRTVFFIQKIIGIGKTTFAQLCQMLST